jgi:hypothetical protein
MEGTLPPGTVAVATVDFSNLRHATLIAGVHIHVICHTSISTVAAMPLAIDMPTPAGAYHFNVLRHAHYSSSLSTPSALHTFSKNALV